MDSRAITETVSWAEKQAAPSHRKPTKRLTQEEIGLLLKLHRDGLSQPQIAQRLDCDQAAVSRWLSKLTDSTDVAKSYLRGSALRMAKNIVQKGLARDHIQALNGLGVLQEQSNTGVTLILNGLTLHGTGRAETVEGDVLSPLCLPEAGEGQQKR